MAKIGEILIQKGLITQEQLETALVESKKKGEVIGKTVIRLKMVTEEQLLKVLGEQLGVPFYSTLKEIQIPQDVIDAVPVKFVWHYKIIPIKKEDKIITIAVSDPLAIWSMEDLKLHLGYDIDRVLATQEEILDAIRRYYGFGADTVEKILAQNLGEKEEKQAREEIAEVEQTEKSAEDASVIELVNQVLSEAIARRATDIHIEPYRNKVRIRYRIDGVLYDMNVSEQIKYLHRSIIARIKIISNLNVVEKRLPQDGRAIVKIQGKQVDLRISIIPSVYGEGIVIRVLPVQYIFDLKELGFAGDDLAQIEELMDRPHGIIFLTGPTGSGKTTTLYACLNRLNNDEVKIITIEDPVEYELSGIMQIQVKPEIDFTFARALRSILRHDPDIMMIGEVRDLETAELAIRTSLTGHLIFSTLHTNDAASGAARLIDIGIEPYLIASSVNAFIAQRLVRVICPDCKEERKDNHNLPPPFNTMKTYFGRGCDACNGIGYRSRKALHEILPVVPEIQDLILEKSSTTKVKEKARELGYRTLRESGIECVREGQTTPEELMQVVDLKE
ncbi:MAG: type II/IV secretion system protein [PVC group bacterium]|nr:type II/IV secretion system protein [PVC group bacterium]